MTKDGIIEKIKFISKGIRQGNPESDRYFIKTSIEMKTIQDVRKQLCFGQFELSRHAFWRAVQRNISEQEIKEAGENVIIIEEYPEDKYSPSCLLLGWTDQGRPLHLQVSLSGVRFNKNHNPLRTR